VNVTAVVGAMTSPSENITIVFKKKTFQPPGLSSLG
jgi:hypothetical protein